MNYKSIHQRMSCGMLKGTGCAGLCSCGPEYNSVLEHERMGVLLPAQEYLLPHSERSGEL